MFNSGSFALFAVQRFLIEARGFGQFFGALSAVDFGVAVSLPANFAQDTAFEGGTESGGAGRLVGVRVSPVELSGVADGGVMLDDFQALNSGLRNGVTQRATNNLQRLGGSCATMACDDAAWCGAV